jgi:hypothetical protein
MWELPIKVALTSTCPIGTRRTSSRQKTNDLHWVLEGAPHSWVQIPKMSGELL